jgi:hypothetical protein
MGVGDDVGKTNSTTVTTLLRAKVIQVALNMIQVVASGLRYTRIYDVDK